MYLSPQQVQIILDELNTGNTTEKAIHQRIVLHHWVPHQKQQKWVCLYLYHTVRSKRYFIMMWQRFGWPLFWVAVSSTIVYKGYH